MLIKHKLIANTGVLVLAMALMLGLLAYASSALQHDINIAGDIGKVENSVLQLRRNEKDFLARKDLKYFEKFNVNMKLLHSQVRQLKLDFASSGLPLNEFANMQSVLTKYHQLFKDLVSMQQRIGLNAKDALYGDLRSAVHNVEELIGKDNFQLRSEMLQLRRNEKDFMLRLDDKYVEKLKSNISKLILSTNNSDLPVDRKQQITTSLSNYEGAFLNLVDAQKQLGYHSTMGLLGEMRKAVHQVDDILEQLINKSEQAVIENISFVNTLAYSLFFVVLVLGVLIAWAISKSILTRITDLKGGEYRKN